MDHSSIGSQMSRQAAEISLPSSLEDDSVIGSMPTDVGEGFLDVTRETIDWDEFGSRASSSRINLAEQSLMQAEAPLDQLYVGPELGPQLVPYGDGVSPPPPYSPRRRDLNLLEEEIPAPEPQVRVPSPVSLTPPPRREERLCTPPSPPPQQNSILGLMLKEELEITMLGLTGTLVSMTLSSTLSCLSDWKLCSRKSKSSWAT